jgi:NAD(P) transhydrogenase subunit alpha
MTFKIAVVRESRPNEKRVAMAPSVAEKLIKLGAEISLQPSAGAASKYGDASFKDVAFSEDLGQADVVLSVQPLTLEQIKTLKSGAISISFIYAHREVEVVKALRDQNVTCFAMELVPRITRAQSMDALSSQAALAGYYAPILAATLLPRMIPMTTFATGSIRAAKGLVLGAGVAGLQAIATLGKKLGAVVEAYDVRPETKEQCESLGAKFVNTGVDARGEGGYARPLTDAEKATVDAVLTKHIQAADIIVTTAAIPGRASPKLISKAQVDGMKSGAVIIDLAAEGGGNCEYSVPGETVQVGDVTIAAPLNVPSMLAGHASELYAKNQYNLLELMVKDKTLVIDWEDEVLAKACLTHAGEIKNEAAKKAVEA